MPPPRTLRRRAGLRHDAPRYELMNDASEDMQMMIGSGGV